MKRKVLVLNDRFVIFMALCFSFSPAILSHPYTEKITQGTMKFRDVYKYVEVPYTAEEVKAIDAWLLQIAKLDIDQFLKSQSHE